ncbi:MAG: hypothetical protein P8J01_02675 [Acidimicrobiales bacterium]|nr:hypothetical protein [Acidimicrobiales bacterium]
MKYTFSALLFCIVLFSCSSESDDQTYAQLNPTSTLTPTLTPSLQPSPTLEPLPSPAPSENPEVVATPATHAGCTSSGHQAPRREEILDNHELWLGSLYGSSLDEGYKLLSGASVPDGLLYKDVIHLWWVSSSDHTIHHGTVNEGSLTDLGSISIDGEIFSGMVDPDLVQLPDGTLGLTVLDGFDKPGPPGPICHLRSTDGQEFFTHSTMLDLEERFDPSVVLVEDHWWLAVGVPADENSFTEIYRGSIGQEFTLEAQVKGAIPDIAYFDGQFHLLTCSLNGMLSYTSPDGKDWNLLDTILISGCDPSRVTGTNFLAYKKEQGGSNEMKPPLPGEPHPTR